MRPARLQNEPVLRRLWWLDPSLLFAVVIGGTMLVAFAQSDSAYRLYGTPKYLGTIHLWLAFAAAGVFVIGRWLAGATGRAGPSTPPAAEKVVLVWFWLATILTLFGYAVWLGLGVKNGFSLGMLREFLTTDDPHLAETMFTDMFANWKGITTCTQFGVAAVPLGLWLFFRGHRVILWPLTLLIALAAVRGLIFGERLALIELVVPGFVVAIRFVLLGQPLSRFQNFAVQLFPLLGLAALLLFFGGFEYFRSWRYYVNDFDSYAEFTLWRIGGYYTTAHNNGALALETQPTYPLPYATLRQFWSIPGLASTPLGYTHLTGIDPTTRHLGMLEQFGTPELNSDGGLFQPALDFGLSGFLLFWFACGFAAGRLYRAYLVGTLAGLSLYPLVFLAILETPRFLYLCYPRSLPAIATLLVVVWLTSRAARPASAPFAAMAPA
jgi:hypothetical protein